MTATIDLTQPKTIRTLEIGGTHGDESSDHVITGALALAATAAAATNPELVAFRADNDSFRVLGQFGRLQMDVCGYETIIGDVFGRDSHLYHEAMAEISRTHVRHHIVTAKRAGAPFSFFRQALELCVKHYGRYASFWLQTFPVLVMPRSIMLSMRSWYQRLRH